MKASRKVLLGSALAVAAAAGIAGSASAYRGDYTQQGPNYSEERHQLMEQAFENNDYNLWKSQMNGRGVTNVINESNFAQFAEAHRLVNEGKYDEANQIREELGLRTNNGEATGLGRGNGNGGGQGMGIHQNR